jgi:hypothetical protein
LCGDPDHFIANHPKIKGKSDSGKRKDKHDYAFVKHKSQGRKMSKEALKKKYIKNTKAQKYAFLASLSDPKLDSSDNDSSSSSDDESKKKLQDKLNKLCFLTDTTKDRFCFMALGDEMVGGDDNNSDSKVPRSAVELVVELDTLNDALRSQDHLL